MRGIINGKDVLFLVNTGDGYEPFVCAKDLSIETTASFVGIATKGDGAWRKSAYQDIGYTISMTSVVKLDEESFSAFDILAYQRNFLELPYKIVFVDQDNNKPKTIKGVALVERVNISANTSQLSLGDISLTGSGAYTEIDCEAFVGHVSTAYLSNNTVSVTLSEITGNPASFFYQLDNEIEVETTETFFYLLSVPGGNHTLIVTPVCEDGNRGEETVYDFSTIGVVENPTCGMPTGINVSSISTTSAAISWVYGSSNTSVDITLTNVNTGNPLYFTGITTSPYIVHNLLPGTTYEMSLQGNCGVSNKSQPYTVPFVTLDNLTIFTRLHINNYSSDITVTRVLINGAVERSTPVEPNTIATESIHAGMATVVVEYTHAGSGAASIAVNTTRSRACQNAAVASGILTLTYPDISIPSLGVEININPNACTG
jgi:hypothetical protein